MKFKVTCNKPSKVDSAELEVEAVDESAAIAAYVKKNQISGKSSTFVFKAELVGEDNRSEPAEKSVDEPVADPVEKPKKTTRKKPATKKADSE